MRHRHRAKPGRRHRLRYVLLGIGAVVLMLFLPGPNGVLRVWAKHRRAGRLEQEMKQLSTQIDSLDSCRRYLANPDSARELARRTFGSLASDSAPGTH